MTPPTLVLSLIALVATVLAAPAATRAARRGPDPLAARTAGLERRPGLLDTYLDRRQGRVWLVAPAGQGELGRYLYVEGLRTGLGSNPVGLDRGQLGRTRLVALRRLGDRLLIEELNLRYRALSERGEERRAAAESFATAVLWAGKVEAEGRDGEALVDLTGFLVRDAHDVVGTLRDTEQGEYELDPERSALDLDGCPAFPDNLEFEALLTFHSDGVAAAEVHATSPSPPTLTLVQHHSLVRLPDDGYRPRPFDPRAGVLHVWFHDYAAPLDQPLERRWIVRHRLRKTDPGAERSPVARPLVYYVDRGIPEPVRSAVVEGASWWAEAFEAAGFEDAFRVELLPEGAHPLDVRYNVIQWVHRATRGWSYGGGVVDPRTGERLKGHISLGSLRVRQDRLLFEGLLGADATGSGGPGDPLELALARIRQLSAHEVGHALGFAHNFAASTYGGRASVMDYPAPLVRLGEDGELDLSAAYGVGVGEWDRQAVRYAYREYPPGTDEAAALAAVVTDGLARGLVYLTDDDARPDGAAQPVASLWDNGTDPVAQLETELAVRRRALDRFGAANVAPGRPLALLEEVLATVYLRHRYQLRAAGKTLGGVDYRYALRGDGQPPARPLPAAAQRRALEVLLTTLEPAALDLPDALLGVLPPRPDGFPPNRELFAGRTGPLFDPLAAAATAARLTIAELLQPERAARLVDQHRRDPDLPGLSEVLDALTAAAFTDATGEPPRLAAIRHAVQEVQVKGLIDLATSGATGAVRWRADAQLRTLHARLQEAALAGDPTAAGLADTIRRHLERQSSASPDPAPPPPPPGDPIGSLGSLPDLGACSFDFSEPRQARLDSRR